MTTRPLHAVLVPPREAGGRLLEALAAALDGSGPAILPLDPTLPRGRLDELIAAFAPTSVQTTQESQRLPGARRAGQAGLVSPGVADDVAVVLATSGSTGMPKGAELTAGALLASARASLARLGAAPGERWLCCLPVHHISGLGVLVRSLLAGSVPVVRDRVDAGAVAWDSIRAGQPGSPSGTRAGRADAAEPARCSYVSLVPTQLRRLLDVGTPLAGFRAILLGGAPIPRGMMAEAAAAGARVVTTYGMTETCGGCVYDGVPLDGVKVASDADGRVAISGPVLFSGYRLAPELTSAVLRDGWFVTSDLGEVTAAGRLLISGRADDMINTGGEKVVSGDVEQVLRGCPSVRDAVVVGTPDPDWGERVTAVIVPADPAASPSLDELRSYVRDRLPRYAAPRAVAVVSELPMLASGKPDRQLIRDIAERHAT